MNHFFVPECNILEDRIIIDSSEDIRHIKHVLRLNAGAELSISANGSEMFLCAIEGMSDGEIVCLIKERSTCEAECPVKFHLFQGLPKLDKLEHIIQKSVELGVFEITPVNMLRSVVKYDEKKAQLKKERWQKISEAAAKQSRRGIVPKVNEIIGFKEALEKSRYLDILLMPYENFKDMTQTRQALSLIKPGMSVGIFVGPEGGIDGSEAALAKECGAKLISLGNRILRTETAPLMLLSVLTFAQEVGI